MTSPIIIKMVNIAIFLIAFLVIAKAAAPQVQDMIKKLRQRLNLSAPEIPGKGEEPEDKKPEA